MEAAGPLLALVALPWLVGCGAFDYAQGVTAYHAVSAPAPAGCAELGMGSATAPYRAQALRELQHQAKVAGGDAVEVVAELPASGSRLRIRGRLLDCRRQSADP